MVTKIGPESVTMCYIRARSFGMKLGEYSTMHNFFIPMHSHSVNDKINKISTGRYLGILVQKVTMELLSKCPIGRYARRIIAHVNDKFFLLSVL